MSLSRGGASSLLRSSALRLLAALATAAVWLAVAGVSSASAESSVMTWGGNGDGQLGIGINNGPEGGCFYEGFCSRTPVAVKELSGVTAIAGASQGLALLGNGTVMAWGRNADGQLGNGSRENGLLPEEVPGLSGVTAIATSYGISMALLGNGTVMDWGENENGQLGNGTTGEYTGTPVHVSGLSEVTAIATGGSYCLALLKNGTVMAWGSYGFGSDSHVPVRVEGLSGVTAIAADGGHSLALLANGKVMAWGEDEYGELGDGGTEYSGTPVRVKGLSEVVGIADGADHNLALLANGKVMAWGQNDWGQLGDGLNSEGASEGPEICGPTACSTIPVEVSKLSGVTAVATGYGQSLALLGNQTVMSWGENFDGQLGNGGSEPGRDLPGEVEGLSGATAIAGGDYFSLAEVHGETGSISGKVTATATGEAIVGANVCATLLHGTGSWRCATTNAAGEYTIAVHGDGNYEVRFWAPPGSAYVTGDYYDERHSAAEADTVTVTSGSSTSGIDVQLTEGGRIVGTVTSASTKAPVEGVEVCAPESTAGCVLTSATGEYTISGLQAGEYGVEFHAVTGLYRPQYWNGKLSSSEGQPVSVATGRTTSGIDAELEPVSAAMTGTVRDNVTKRAIKGIEVCAYEAGSEEEEEEEKLFGQCAKTNAAGEYTIAGLTGSEYIVEFNSPSEETLRYATQYYDDKYSSLHAQIVHVLAGKLTTGIDADMEEGGRVTGKVTSAVGKDGVSGIDVCFFAETEELVGCAITSAGGTYETPLLARGSYKVEFTPPFASSLNYVRQYFDNATVWSAAEGISVAAGATTPNVDAELQEGGRIAGTVTHAGTHTALQGALVCALTPSAEVDACAISASTGDYTIAGLAAGEYEVGFDGGTEYPVQYYDDASSFGAAQPVTVAVKGTARGVDAAMAAYSHESHEEAPANTSLPVISKEGTAVGDHLTCSDGTWTGVPTPTLAVQWLGDGTPIVDATSSSYTIQRSDEGHSVSCEVTASNSAGERSAVSASVAIPMSPGRVPPEIASPTSTSTLSPAAGGLPLAVTPPKPDLKPPAPILAIVTSSLAVSGSSVHVQVRCEGKTCAGTIELTMQVVTKTRDAGRTISRKRTLLLAKGSLSLAGGGQRTSVALHLTSVGRRRLLHADRHAPIAVELTLLVPGGKKTRESVLVR